MILFKRKKKKAKKDLFEKGEFGINFSTPPETLDTLKNIADHIDDNNTKFIVSLLYANDMVDTVYPACASCYGISEEKNKTREEKLGYIGRRVKAHHTSILEHSNVVLQVFIPIKKYKFSLWDTITKHNEHIKTQLSDDESSDQNIITLISEVKDVCRYLTTYTDIIIGEEKAYILRMTIGGSVRGYRYIFENIENRKNELFISIFNVLKRVVPKEFFMDFIEEGVMNNYETIIPYDDILENIPQRVLNNIETDTIQTLNMDDLDTISKLLKIKKEKCFDFVSITVDFKKMSRVITQQVTRHRNGITQESQRYVNYSKAAFNSPDKFKEKYDKDKVYNTPIGDFTMQELGEKITSIYESLTDQGVDKEDARGYLPQNIQCSKLFMTFTLRTLFAFLDLRLDSHAQAEINKYANELSSLTQMYADDLNKHTMHDASSIYSKPIYKRLENKDFYEGIDEEV